jgi:hypothetical protein
MNTKHECAAICSVLEHESWNIKNLIVDLLGEARHVLWMPCEFNYHRSTSKLIMSVFEMDFSDNMINKTEA